MGVSNCCSNITCFGEETEFIIGKRQTIESPPHHSRTNSNASSFIKSHREKEKESEIAIDEFEKKIMEI